MRCLRSQGNKIPEHVGVFQVSLWISLLSVDEAREENRVADEEDGRVVADDIPNAIVGVELDSEAAGIACCVSRTAFTTLDSIRI